MNWKWPAVLAASAMMAAALALPAEAQNQSQRRAAAAQRAGQPTVFISRDETGRTRTRLIVTPRSYLDGGTEVLPGQRKFTDYAIPPFHSAIGDVLGPGRDFDRQPLNSRIESGGVRVW
jgi:hypothetical protein